VSTAKTFVIPLALNAAGDLVRAAGGEKGNEYSCPQCLVTIVLRKGEVRRPHFAHVVGTPCSPESVAHKTAKMLIAQVVRSWRAGGPAPAVIRRCPRCHGPHCQRIPERVHRAVVESPLDTCVVPDVTLLGPDGRALAVIEILATHAVDESKKPKLTVPWIELSSDHVLDDPLVWVPVQDHLKALRQCAACNARDAALGARYDANGYLAKPYVCYKCGASMSVYTWRGKSLWDDEHPPSPIPPTIQYRYSRTAGGKYWVNVCPSCRAIQGDWHLRHPDGGPFFGHEPDDDLEWKRICDEGGCPCIGSA
jgi:ssDNA-binding Zn-finger/Zn-ribbon topoisomerase 1